MFPNLMGQKWIFWGRFSKFMCCIPCCIPAHRIPGLENWCISSTQRVLLPQRRPQSFPSPALTGTLVMCPVVYGDRDGSWDGSLIQVFQSHKGNTGFWSELVNPKVKIGGLESVVIGLEGGEKRVRNWAWVISKSRFSCIWVIRCWLKICRSEP